MVPVYVDGLWGSIFSFEGGRFFWKIPKKFRPRVTIRFGKPIEHPKDLEQVRQAVIELGGGKGEVRVEINVLVPTWHDYCIVLAKPQAADSIQSTIH